MTKHTLTKALAHRITVKLRELHNINGSKDSLSCLREACAREKADELLEDWIKWAAEAEPRLACAVALAAVRQLNTFLRRLTGAVETAEAATRTVRQLIANHITLEDV